MHIYLVFLNWPTFLQLITITIMIIIIIHRFKMHTQSAKAESQVQLVTRWAAQQITPG